MSVVMLLDFDNKVVTIDKDTNLFELMTKVQTHLPNWEEWTLRPKKITINQEVIKLERDWFNKKNNNWGGLTTYGNPNNPFLEKAPATRGQVLTNKSKGLEWVNDVRPTLEPHKLSRLETGRFGAGDSGRKNIANIPQDAKRALEEISRPKSRSISNQLESFQAINKVNGEVIFAGQLLAEFK